MYGILQRRGVAIGCVNDETFDNKVIYVKISVYFLVLSSEFHLRIYVRLANSFSCGNIKSVRTHRRFGGGINLTSRTTLLQSSLLLPSYSISYFFVHAIVGPTHGSLFTCKSVVVAEIRRH